MSLQYPGRAKSSITALACAPLVKGEQYVKWLTQFSAELRAIVVTDRRKDCRGGKKSLFPVFYFFLVAAVSVSRGRQPRNVRSQQGTLRIKDDFQAEQSRCMGLIKLFLRSRCWGPSQK